MKDDDVSTDSSVSSRDISPSVSGREPIILVPASRDYPPIITVPASPSMDQGQADTIGLPDLYLRPPTDHDHSDTIRLPDLYLGSSTDQDQADTLGLPDLYLGSSMDQEQADTIGLPDLYLGSSDVQEQSDRAQIFCGTLRDPREGLWMIKFSKICLHQNSIL